MEELANRTVESLVRDLLGPTADDMDESSLNAFAKRFVAAGRAAVRLAGEGSPSEAARSLRTFDRLRSASRVALSRRTTTDHETTYVAPRWRAAMKALDENRDRLDRREEVVGYGLAHRVRKGFEEPERCVRVLVSRKLPPEELERERVRHLPKTLRNSRGDEIPVDVVEVGPLEHQAIIGDSVGPDGDDVMKGTIGAFGRDLTTHAPVALTAMHVTSKPGVYLSPCLRDDPIRLRLGSFLDGSLDDIDAAKISVEPPAIADPVAPGGIHLNGWRPVMMPEDRGVEVRMYGATSGFQRGYIAETCHSLPTYRLGEVILVDIHSDLGDSGSGLFDKDGVLLGLLVGSMMYGGYRIRVFGAIRPILDRLGCDLPPT